MADGINWIQWVTVVEIPLLLALVGVIVKNRLDAQRAIRAMDKDLTDFKLQVADKYASIAHLKDVEERLNRWMEKLDRKLDRILDNREHGHD